MNCQTERIHQMLSLVGENRHIPSQIIAEFQHVEGRELIIKVPEREKKEATNKCSGVRMTLDFSTVAEPRKHCLQSSGAIMPLS